MRFIRVNNTRWMYLLMVVSFMLFIMGCEETVLPVIETGRPFTLFGLFTPELDTQWVRVFPIEDRLVQARPEPIDVNITSTELQTGDLRTWRDSLLQAQDGKYSHVFWSPFRATFGHSYRLDAVRSDGTLSHAEVEVPPEAELIVEEPYSIGFVIQPVFVQGEVPHLLRIEVEYDILFEQIVIIPFFGPDTFLTHINFTFPIDDKKRREGDGWHITLNLTKDHDVLNDLIPIRFVRPTPHEIFLQNIELRMIAACESWDPPGGLLDPEILVQPGVMSNVENGFGFIGAGYRLKKEWLPSQEWIERAGFRYLEGV